MLAVERKVFLHERHHDPTLVQFSHGPQKVLGISRQPVHRVDNEGVASPHVLQRRQQLGPVGVLAARLVSEGAIKLDAVKLPLGVLVERADSDVPDAVSLAHVCLPLCHRPNGWRQESLKTYHDMCQEKPTNGPILTRFGRPQRVRLGSTVSRRSAATRISNLSFVTIRSPWSREQNLEQIWLS